MKLRNRYLLAIIANVFLLASYSQLSIALDSDDLADLVGFTIIASTNVKGDFEGADFDKPVALDNGMVFEFQTYSYTYSYRPSAIVFARTFRPEEMRRFGLKNAPDRPVTLYKLIIEDEIYDVTRIR